MNLAPCTELISRTVSGDMQTAFFEGGGVSQQNLTSCLKPKRVKRAL